MSKAPLVSVVMAVYNDEVYLPEAINSILTQEFSNFEFLIIDDCSSDKTLELLKGYKASDPRIRLFKRDINVGLTKNLNYLISKAKGKYIARMDGDDIALPNRFKEQVSLLQQSPDLHLVWSGCDFIFENEGVVCSMRLPSLIEVRNCLKRHKNYIVHPSVMMDKEAVLSVGAYNEEFRSGQDGDLWRRMLESGKQFNRIDQSLLQFRLRSNSVTAKRTGRSKDKNVAKAKVCLNNRRYKESLPYIAKVASLKQKVMLYVRYLVGETLVEKVQQVRARKTYDDIHKFSVSPPASKVEEIH